MLGIALATIGFGLSTSRGEQRPPTRPVPMELSERIANLKKRSLESQRVQEGLSRLMESTTRPTTQQDRDDQIAALRLQLEEIRRLSEEYDRGNRRPATQPFVVEPWMSTDMPPGSSPREFNGFTYYIVPLGK